VSHSDRTMNTGQRGSGVSDGPNGDNEVETLPDSKARPDYESLKALALQLDRPESTLVGTTLNNDPFYAGQGRRKKAAEWFLDIWNTYKCRTGIHLRRIHYLLISQENGVVKYRDSLIYENTDKCWDELCRASKHARWLGLVSVDAFEDKRNAKPFVHLPDYAPPKLSVESKDVEIEAEVLELIDDDPLPAYEDISELFAWVSSAPKHLAIPDSIEAPTFLDPSELPDPPEVRVDPYIQPPFFHLEIWCEKTTVNHVLEPLATQYHLNVITGAGFLSMTHVRDLIERAELSRRPVRIFYISDFDPSGRSMPVAIARMIEFLAWGKGLDIELRAIALTPDQCAELRLPRTPITKDKRGDEKKGKAKFEERFGEGATELDALEALHPGYLHDLLVRHIEYYQDPDFRERLREKHVELKNKIEEMRDEVIGAHPELDELRAKHRDLGESRNDQVDELLAERLSALNTEISGLIEAPIRQLNEEITEIREEVGEIEEEIKEQVKDRLDKLNKRIDDINEAAGPLYTEARELAQAKLAEINSTIAEIDRDYAVRITEAARRFQEAQEVVEAELNTSGQKVIDAFELPKPVAAVADDEPLFDSKRDYIEQIEHYAKHSGKLTVRKRLGRPRKVL
jgi:predicted  nucleic acid-binding Zn-ribbon protein